MARYIDIDNLIFELNHKAMWQGRDAGFNTAIQTVHMQPIADVVEVKHARWIEESSLYVYCSNCRTREYPREHHFKSKICPECGAKMDGRSDT